MNISDEFREIFDVSFEVNHPESIVRSEIFFLTCLLRDF